MEKAIIEKVSVDYTIGACIGDISDNYKLHWANDFVKTGKEYSIVMKTITPKARQLFDDLIFNHLDFHNKLICNGYPLTKSDIKNITGLSDRRINELLLELYNIEAIAKLTTKTIKCYIVNPIIAAKSGIVNYSILNLFAEYKIKHLNKEVKEEYDLSIQKILEVE